MFHSARLKLTTWYLMIIMFVSITFSLVIYRVLISEVERFEQAQRFRIERRLKEGSFFPGDTRFHRFAVPVPPNPELIEETKQRVLLMLVFVNLAILAISGGFGYILAGRTLRPIKQMVDEQNRFISDASHELKTPLTSLKSAFEVFLRGKNHNLHEAKTIISESINEVNKLQSLSESMLQLVQYQMPNRQSRFEKISVKNIVNEAVRKIEPIAKQRNIEIVQNLKDVQVKGDRYILIDLVVILLDNAVKYSPEKSKIEITSIKKDDIVSISVKDYGIGISPKDIPHIFDRFYRADAARVNSSTGGHGLGLSIAKKIANIHNGSIIVESELSKGALFIVRLPVLQSSRRVI